MEQPRIDIYKNLKRNQNITKIVVIVSAIVCIVAILSVINLYKNNNKFIYRISKENQLMPLEKIEKNELKTILRKGHIKLFLDYFYGYDQWNYKNQIEKSLWLIDDSGKALYHSYRNDGHFNELIQSNSSQEIDKIKIEIDNNGNFICHSRIEINKIGQINRSLYKLVARGTLIRVSQNYPKNPYGYLITNFKEVSKNKIEE